MKITFLGTGTSSGVPTIGCSCPVCVSDNPRNKRLRTSIYLEAGGLHVLVDTTPDFRTQALTYRIPRVDVVLLTHAHADHVLGFDDIRRYNTIQKSIIPVYGLPATMAYMNRTFDYVHKDHPAGTYRPLVEFHEITGELELGGLKIEPLEVVHGADPACGFLFTEGSIKAGYFPDCYEMPDGVTDRLSGIDIMILDVLRREPPHPTHMTLDKSVEQLKRIGAARSCLIHMCHDLDHDETQAALPPSMFVSYDGQVIEL